MTDTESRKSERDKGRNQRAGELKTCRDRLRAQEPDAERDQGLRGQGGEGVGWQSLGDGNILG